MAPVKAIFLNDEMYSFHSSRRSPIVAHQAQMGTIQHHLLFYTFNNCIAKVICAAKAIKKAATRNTGMAKVNTT